MKHYKLFIPIVVLVVGIICVFSGLRMCIPLDYFNILSHSLKFSVPVLILYLILIGFRRGSLSKRNFIISLVLSLIAFPLAGLGIDTILNATLNPGEVNTHTVKITGVYACSSSANAPPCAHVESWREKDRVEIFRVSDSDAQRIVAGETQMEIVTRPGTFGFECMVTQRIKED